MALSKKAVISFILFLIILIKDILVSYLELIPHRSSINRLLSWFIILPLTIIGITLSVQVIVGSFLQWKNANRRLINTNFILSTPILLYVLYFMATAIYLLL